MMESKELTRNNETDPSVENLQNRLMLKEPAARDDQTAALDNDFKLLLKSAESDQFRALWLEIQSGFVDDPFNSVKEADELISNVIESITETIVNNRIALEDQWISGNKVSTEDLRLVLKQYRSFLDELLALGC